MKWRTTTRTDVTVGTSVQITPSPDADRPPSVLGKEASPQRTLTSRRRLGCGRVRRYEPCEADQGCRRRCATRTRNRGTVETRGRCQERRRSGSLPGCSGSCSSHRRPRRRCTGVYQVQFIYRQPRWPADDLRLADRYLCPGGWSADEVEEGLVDLAGMGPGDRVGAACYADVKAAPEQRGKTVAGGLRR